MRIQEPARPPPAEPSTALVVRQVASLHALAATAAARGGLGCLLAWRQGQAEGPRSGRVVRLAHVPELPVRSLGLAWVATSRGESERPRSGLPAGSSFYLASRVAYRPRPAASGLNDL